MCCSPWGLKESDMTEWLNWTELIPKNGSMGRLLSLEGYIVWCGLSHDVIREGPSPVYQGACGAHPAAGMMLSSRAHILYLGVPLFHTPAHPQTRSLWSLAVLPYLLCYVQCLAQRRGLGNAFVEMLTYPPLPAEKFQFDLTKHSTVDPQPCSLSN